MALPGMGRYAHPNPVTQRRKEQEDVRQSLQADLSANFRLNHVASWQAKGSNVVRGQNLKGVIAKVKQSEAEKLAERRERLKELLAADDAQYRVEIMATAETPAAQRERLVARAQALKAAKDERRRAFAEEQAYQRWRASQDDLRLLDSHQKLQNAHKGRLNQMEEKQHRKEQEREERRLMEEDWHRILEHQEAKLQEEDRIKEEALLHTRDGLIEQISEIEQARRDAAALREQEKQAFQKQMQLDAENERKMKEEAYAAKLARAAELRAFNEEMSQRNNLSRMQEQALEQEMVSRGRQQDEEETRRATETKRRMREDMEARQRHLAQKKAEEEEIQREIQRLTQIELDKANAKRDLTKQKEELARQKLMQDVHQTRWQQLMTKEERRQQERQQVVRDREALEMDLRVMKEEQQRLEQERHRDRLAHKKVLEQQILDRKQRENQYFDSSEEERRLAEQEAKYRARAARELESANQQRPIYGRKKFQW